jgi:hypothetical protein
VPYFFIERYTASYVHQWEAFVAAVGAGGPGAVTGLGGRATLVVSLAPPRSRIEGRPVAVSEVG